ncbi:uncharacterized protein TRIADDRAFT_61330 [Trichoplax adhaerens]|uniref:Methyltransferase domain-containing protein n=1 Tax=Trichoplax adhaerens TaxID=10228 RepID=B3SAP3_TRIAD|nr:predicted protein [Trichoplax adhaerens]EDV20191.1 predicted protein [Trichoplax adhaerens]|eukprot:XP_002117352.1 predicted protein [Trichoplax adhaerens]
MHPFAIKTDVYEYDKAFRAYKNLSNEKRNGSIVNHTFLNKLQNQGLLNDDKRVTLVADIACGEGDTIIRYLKGIKFKSGLDIRGLDNNFNFIGSGVSLNQNILHDEKVPPIYHNLSNAYRDQTIPLKNFQITFGDLLKSDVAQLLYTKEEITQSMNRFRLVYLIHGIYYLSFPHKNGRFGVTNLVDSIVTDLLTDDGIALLFHSSLKVNGNVALSYFIRNHIKNFIPTDEEYRMLSADSLIRYSCHRLGINCYDIPYTSAIRFSNNFKMYVDIFRNPSRYHELHDNTEALQDLQMILFLGHRSPNDLFMDRSPRGLQNLLDILVEKLDEEGNLKIYSCMQIILSKKASSEMRQKVEKVAEECRNLFSQISPEKIISML